GEQDALGTAAPLVAHARQPAPTFNPPSANAYWEIDARMVFNPARKAIPKSVGDRDNAATPPLSATLIGVMLDGHTRIAMFKADSMPIAQSVAEGAAIDGWQVRQVAADHVVVE